MRRQQARPLAEALHAWLVEQRQRLANADTTARVRISANVTGHFGECDRWAEG